MGRVFRYSEEAFPVHKKPKGWTRFRMDFPVVLQAFLLAVLVFVPFFIPEYRKMGSPHGIVFLIPVIMPILLLFVPDWFEGKTAGGRFLSVYLLGAIFLAGILFPFAHYLGPGKSAQDMVKAIATHLPPGETLYQYQDCFYGIDYYTGRRTAVVGDPGEMAFGVARIAEGERRRYFPTTAEFVEDVHRGHIRYCIAEGQGHVTGLRRQIPVVRVLWENGKFYMLYLAKA